MKNFIYTAIILILTILPFTANAQNGYTYTLIDNGGYSYTVAAVPNFDSGTFEPITESYGFVIVLPDGNTATFNQYLPSGTVGTETFVDGANVAAFAPDMADNDMYLITTITNAATLDAHATDEIIPLVTLTVNGTPSIGEISLLANDSVLADASEINGALDSFMQVDTVDDGTVNFSNGVVTETGLSGTTSFGFSTLGIEDTELTGLSLYPNPASNVFHIKGLQEDTNVNVYDVNGRTILSTAINSNIHSINVGQIPSGMYVVTIANNSGQTTKKLIIK